MTARRPRLAATLLALACALALVAAPPETARAQSSGEVERARTLFRNGIELEAAGDWAGALAKFEEVARVKKTPQVRFHIARCQEKLGRLNEALGGYRLAEHEATQAGDKDVQALSEIVKARDALESRIPKLIVERGIGADSARIELDGVLLGSAQVGRPVSVDPGPHGIRVTLADRRSFERTVYLKEAQKLQVILDVPSELRQKRGGGSPARAGVETPAPPPAAPPERDRPRREPEGGGSALPWVITGVGAAGLVASGAFFLVAKDAESQLDDECLDDLCPDTLEDTQLRGERFSILSGVALGVGVLGAGVGVTMLLLESQPEATVSLNVRGAPRFAGAEVVGRF